MLEIIATQKEGKIKGGGQWGKARVDICFLLHGRDSCKGIIMECKTRESKTQTAP